MKVIIAGSRTLNHQPTIDGVISRAFNGWLAADPSHWTKYYRPEIVSGGAHGVDFCGEQFAKKADFVLTVFPADWEKHGKAAGFIRNQQMAEYADALIAVWNGRSKGTFDMITRMFKLNKLIHVETFP